MGVSVSNELNKDRGYELTGVDCTHLFPCPMPMEEEQEECRGLDLEGERAARTLDLNDWRKLRRDDLGDITRRLSETGRSIQ